MRKRDRVQAALRGEAVDRTPYSLWRHFHRQDQTAEGLAQATLAFYQQYQPDVVKLTPSGFYAVEDWGARVELSRNDDTPPRLKKPVIHEAADWRELPALTSLDGALGRELEAIKLVKKALNVDDTPLLMTVFSPLTIAYKLAGDKILEHLREHEIDVSLALATIAETTSRFAVAALSAGADGLFFASQLAQAHLLDEDACRNFGLRYDMIVLERVQEQQPLLVLHLHGENVHFNLVNDYPVQAISWHPRLSGPSLAEALSLTDKALMTGLSRQVLEHGSAADVQQAVEAAVMATGGRRLILAPSCVISPATPAESLQAVANAVGLQRT
ncbi:MAG: uroporphyrinogen decarboxylase family protein [Anaerolineae bacterium]